MVGNSKEVSAPAEGLSASPEGTKTSARPFGQRVYDLHNFRPTLTGPHYKFTLLLPVSEKEDGQEKPVEVFTDSDLKGLKRLFREDFGGGTYFEVEGAPPIHGDWIGQNGKVVVDWHVRMDVYTKRHEGAIEYFTELKSRLLRHAKEVRHAEQEEIVIEINETVSFVPKRSLEAVITESEERLKNLKR